MLGWIRGGESGRNRPISRRYKLTADKLLQQLAEIAGADSGAETLRELLTAWPNLSPEQIELIAAALHEGADRG